MSVWRCAVETMEPNSFAGVSRKEKARSCSSPSASSISSMVSSVGLRSPSKRRRTVGRSFLFLGNLRRHIDEENEGGEQLLAGFRPMVAPVVLGDEQRGGQRLAFGFHVFGREARQGIEARLLLAGNAEGIEVIDFLIERGASPSRRLGVLALGIEDEGRAAIAQQMRNNERDALAGARRGHNQHMLFGVQLEQHFVDMAEAHAVRVV